MDSATTPATTPRRQHPKPKAPNGGRPLSWHKARGYWFKKHHGVQIPLAKDHKAALAKWHKIAAGLVVASRGGKRKATVGEVRNDFLSAQEERVERGEITAGTFALYRRWWDEFARGRKQRAVEELEPSDFRTARNNVAADSGEKTAEKLVVAIRVGFNWAVTERLIPTLPDYGNGFATIPQRQRRKARREKVGDKPTTWEPDEIRALLTKADAEMRAAILLAINGGMGSADLANLTTTHVKGDVLHYPRPKTEIDRYVPLWPETITAMASARKVVAERLARECNAKAREILAAHYFVTPKGHLVARDKARNDDKGIKGVTRIDWIADRFKALCEAAGVERQGRTFYTFRHTFRTAAVGTPPELVKVVIGHKLPGLDETYVRNTLKRLSEVTNHVRAWLGAIPSPSPAAAAAPVAPAQSRTDSAQPPPPPTP